MASFGIQLVFQNIDLFSFLLGGCAAVTAAVMAKKRGRPSKQTPSSSTPKQEPFVTASDAISINFSLLNDQILNLEGLDSLDSKQVNNMLKNLDAIKEKLHGKHPASPEVEVAKAKEIEEAYEECSTPKNKHDAETEVQEKSKQTNPEADNNDDEHNGSPWQRVTTRHRARGKGNSPSNLGKPDHG
ncbi:hypothetical protein RIF29_08579 [Crotalaria pallida]|uniref:Uncharacterized protein n=1 Tax=Crotalaria pallida TaxID=3830 RepID=A0AAN9FTS7_CROPI